MTVWLDGFSCGLDAIGHTLPKLQGGFGSRNAFGCGVTDSWLYAVRLDCLGGDRLHRYGFRSDLHAHRRRKGETSNQIEGGRRL